ncbi:MAG: triple tyrosine motif-containing protein [Burkholderiales bacterium]
MLAVIGLLAALSFQPALAQTAPSGDQRIVQESWTFKDGAPEFPTSFAQTADGYMWVGAPSGLFRFDGMRFELFQSAFGERLNSTSVSTLFAANDGLWVGYVFGGFSFVKSGRVKNFANVTGGVTGFAQDSNGIVWAGARGGAGKAGLWRFDGISWQPVGADLDFPPAPVAQLGFDREGTLWVLAGIRGPETPKQLYLLEPRERKFRKAAGDLVVTSFTWDADNYVVTRKRVESTATSSLVAFDRSLPAFPVLKTQSDQILDRANGIWLIPMEGGVLRHPAKEPLAETIADASTSNSEVYAFNPRAHARLVDREGSVWIGSDTAVHRFSYSPLMQLDLPKWPTPHFVLAPDEGGRVWVSAGDGVGRSSLYYVADGVVDFQTTAPGASSFAYRAPDSTFYFGGEGGLFHMVGRSLTRIELPPDIPRGLVTMSHDGSGGFLVSFGGLGLYRLNNGAWARYQGPSDSATATTTTGTKCPGAGVVIAFTDSLKRIWLGCTNSRLAVLDGDREQAFGPDDGVKVGNVTAIFGKGSKIWIGGEFGLQQFESGRLHAIEALDKESLRGISGIVETDSGDLWLNGLGGVIHVRREEIVQALANPGYRVTAERLDRRAGLPGLPSQLRQMPTAVEGTDGRLWFTVNNGVVWLDPRRGRPKAPPPPISIQSISADDKGYELDQPLEFPPGTSNVQFRYAAVSLLHPESIRFRYRLHEIDKDWQEAAATTFVSYRSLAPGHYHFEVASTDPIGIWSDKSAKAEFTILPAWYQAYWFRALCLVALVGLAWAGYQYRVRSLHRRFEMTLDARVAERTRIARDLHDTLLQSFQGLLLRFQTALNLLPDRPVESKQILESAIDQAAEAITEGRDAVQGLRASATEMNDLADSIRALGEELADESSAETSLRVEVQGTPRALHPIVRDEVFRIAGEALRNAFHHAAAKQIELELRYEERQLRVRVRDDGMGMDAEVLSAGGREGHFGLHGMRERAKLVGGSLTVWSGLDTGTEVELSVPAPRAYSISSPFRSRLPREAFGRSDTGDS